MGREPDRDRAPDAPLVRAFEDWIAEAAEQEGETALVRVTVGYLRRSLGAERASVVLHNPDGRTTREWVLAQEGAVVPAGPSVPRAATVAAQALALGHAVAVPDVRQSEYLDCAALAERGLRSALVAPMIVGGRRQGALVLAAAEPDRFGDAERRVAAWVARYFAGLREIERLGEKLVESHGQREEQARCLDALHGMTLELDVQQSRRELLEAVCATLPRILQTNRVSVALICEDDPESFDLYVRTEDDTALAEPRRYRLDGTNIGRAIRERRLVALNGRNEENRPEQLVTEAIQSSMVAPIHSGGRRSGRSTSAASGRAPTATSTRACCRTSRRFSARRCRTAGSTPRRRRRGASRRPPTGPRARSSRT